MLPSPGPRVQVFKYSVLHIETYLELVNAYVDAENPPNGWTFSFSIGIRPGNLAHTHKNYTGHSPDNTLEQDRQNKDNNMNQAQPNVLLNR